MIYVVSCTYLTHIPNCKFSLFSCMLVHWARKHHSCEVLSEARRGCRVPVFNLFWRQNTMRKYNTAVLQTYKGESEPSALPFPHSLAATSRCSSFSAAVKKNNKTCPDVLFISKRADNEKIVHRAARIYWDKSEAELILSAHSSLAKIKKVKFQINQHGCQLREV